MSCGVWSYVEMVAVTPGAAQGALTPCPIGEVPVGQLAMGSASGGEGPLMVPMVSPSLPYCPAQQPLTSRR